MRRERPVCIVRLVNRPASITEQGENRPLLTYPCAPDRRPGKSRAAASKPRERHTHPLGKRLARCMKSGDPGPASRAVRARQGSLSPDVPLRRGTLGSAGPGQAGQARSATVCMLRVALARCWENPHHGGCGHNLGLHLSPADASCSRPAAKALGPAPKPVHRPRPSSGLAQSIRQRRATRERSVRHPAARPRAVRHAEKARPCLPHMGDRAGDCRQNRRPDHCGDVHRRSRRAEPGR